VPSGLFPEWRRTPCLTLVPAPTAGAKAGFACSTSKETTRESDDDLTRANGVAGAARELGERWVCPRGVTQSEAVRTVAKTIPVWPGSHQPVDAAAGEQQISTPGLRELKMIMRIAVTGSAYEWTNTGGSATQQESRRGILAGATGGTPSG